MSIEEDPEGHEIEALGGVGAAFDARSVLEVGCGDGRLTRRYAHRARSVIAIDSDAEAIRTLSGTLANVDARATGIESLALARGSIDVVLFAWSL
jgi:2-polyprenyl-3-methyl-5-hydroxy-6-metoxy-1,4-benzoquinol methylase